MNANKQILHHLANNQVIQLATVVGDTPQICSVHFAFDQDLNLYWSSSRHSHHSQALVKNPQVAAGILLSADSMQCMHILGKGSEVVGDQAINAHHVYSDRFGENPERLKRVLSKEETVAAYYVLSVESIVLFDPVNSPEQPRQEIKPPLSQLN